jgi:hypothetical protein
VKDEVIHNDLDITLGVTVVTIGACMHSVFISYRRSDASCYAAWLCEHLINYFGPGHIFIDIDSISAGTDFVAAINRTLDACEAVIVLIGKDWLNARNEAGLRRLEDPNDFVRLEVAAALKAQRLVIPVLVEGASMPDADKLPASLVALARCNAVELPTRGFARAVANLARQINGGFIESRRQLSTAATWLIESGIEAKSSRFRFKMFFAEGDEFILTGTNFGDQIGDQEAPPSIIHQLVVAALKRNRKTSIYLIVAPFELLESMLPNSKSDLQDRSASRLKMLKHDPRLTSQERARLHIFDHRGAIFLSVALRDPNTDDRRGLAVVTPRWFSDEAGPQRMFFAIEEATAPDIFKKFIEPIYPRIKVDENRLRRQADRTLGGRDIDQICVDLGAKDDPFLSQLADWPLDI